MITRPIVLLVNIALATAISLFACSGQEQRRQDKELARVTRIETLYDEPVRELLQSPKQNFAEIKLRLRHQAGMSDALLERLRIEGYAVSYANPAFEIIHIKIGSRDALARLQQFDGVTMVSLEE